mmetsp:Transcript_77676/g.152037  ORF Transcript_77676/g.152037 Transcript_77676/m.152037 type:complete len:185 (+) Transcript_77676:53-607(+)
MARFHLSKLPTTATVAATVAAGSNDNNQRATKTKGAWQPREGLVGETTTSMATAVNVTTGMVDHLRRHHVEDKVATVKALPLLRVRRTVTGVGGISWCGEERVRRVAGVAENRGVAGIATRKMMVTAVAVATMMTATAAGKVGLKAVTTATSKVGHLAPSLDWKATTMTARRPSLGWLEPPGYC